MPHIHDKIDFTTQALIVHEGRVLLRLHEKYGKWLGVGGHIELDEDPVQALHREVKEESGLEFEIIGGRTADFQDGATDLPAPRFMHRMTVEPGHDHVDLVYIVKAVTTDIKPDASEKPTTFKWFTPEDLADPQYHLEDHFRHYASEAIKIASGYL